MQKANTYKVVREYNNQYAAEELVRRIIRCHMGEAVKKDAEEKIPEHIVK